MTKKHEDYPNEKDYEPNVDKYGKDKGDLPLSDPAESNATKTFRENEAKEDNGTNEPSAFGQNKERQ